MEARRLVHMPAVGITLVQSSYESVFMFVCLSLCACSCPCVLVLVCVCAWSLACLFFFVVCVCGPSLCIYVSLRPVPWRRAPLHIAAS